MKKHWVLGLIAVSACSADRDVDSTSYETEVMSTTCNYPQAFGNAQHTGIACKELHGMRVVARIIQDPDADAENAFSGFMQIHPSASLTSGDWLVVPSKHGFTGNLNADETDVDRSTERYSVKAFKWSPSVSAIGATLGLDGGVDPDGLRTPGANWEIDTDFQTVDRAVGSFTFVTNGYVQQFQPAIGNGSVYVPAASGRLMRVSLTTGATQAVIDPLAGTAFAGDAKTTVNNAVAIDAGGTVYYTVVAWPTVANPFGQQPRGSWLVRVRPDNSVTRVDWSTIATAAIGVPQLHDLCEWPFGTAGTPAASGPGSRPPLFGCGTQRPALNSPIAVRPDNGNLIAYSYANNALGVAFVIEIDGATLAPIRAADTRGHLLHGCGVRLSIDPDDFGCAAITANGTTNIGNDPDFNGFARFRGGDLMDSAPSVASDRSVHICGYVGGFSFGGGYDARGACLGFDGNLQYRDKNEIFGWEVTPTVWPRLGGAVFSFVADQNQYSDLILGVAQYTPTMVQQSFGTVPIDFNANAVDFLDANIAIDSTGTRYAVNGDGHVYKFGADGSLLDSVALTNPDGSVRSMETESDYTARDLAGDVIPTAAGYVYVIKESGLAAQVPTRAAPTERQLAGMVSKRAALGRAISPPPPSH